jgi:DNA-binding GntR family transcriptional regulator
MLSREDLVTIKPRAGYFVTRITLKTLKDMLELREILEVAAVVRAAGRITAVEIAELKAVHAGYSGDDDEAYARYTDENRRFHYLLALASGNRELSQAVGQLHDRLARFMVIRKGGDILQAAHGQVVERLEAGDADGARRVLQAEIRASGAAILERVMQAEGENWVLGAGGESA